MRLPGTVNVPDAKKSKRGRVAALAKLISHDAERVYDLTEFPAVCPPGRTLGTARRDAAASIGPSVPSRAAVRLADVAELDKYGVPDRVKVIVVQGCHPDEPKEGDGSRSAWLFDAVCGLVRCEVPDDVIISILTDPDFGVSKSVLDKGRRALDYARRQIERAHEEVAKDDHRLRRDR